MQPAELPAELLADLRIAFDGAVLEYFLYKRERDLWMADDPVMDVFLALTRFHRVLNLDGEELVHPMFTARTGALHSRRSSSRRPTPVPRREGGSAPCRSTGTVRDLPRFPPLLRCVR